MESVLPLVLLTGGGIELVGALRDIDELISRRLGSELSESRRLLSRLAAIPVLRFKFHLHRAATSALSGSAPFKARPTQTFGPIPAAIQPRSAAGLIYIFFPANNCSCSRLGATKHPGRWSRYSIHSPFGSHAIPLQSHLFSQLADLLKLSPLLWRLLPQVRLPYLASCCIQALNPAAIGSSFPNVLEAAMIEQPASIQRSKGNLTFCFRHSTSRLLDASGRIPYQKSPKHFVQLRDKHLAKGPTRSHTRNRGSTVFDCTFTL